MNLDFLNITAHKVLEDPTNWINAICGVCIIQLNMIHEMHNISLMAKDVTQIATAFGACFLCVYNAVKLVKEYRNKKK